jgi:hypothetical protein
LSLLDRVVVVSKRRLCLPTPYVKTLGIFNFGNGGPKGAPKWGKWDASKGGLFSQRERSPHIGGIMMVGANASTYKVPTFFFLGCHSDMVCQTLHSIHISFTDLFKVADLAQGKADFRRLSSRVPGWLGSMPVGGHMGAYEINGGKYNTAGANWVKWVLLGDQEAAS